MKKQPKIAVLLKDKRNPVHACIGCPKAGAWTATGYECPVFAAPAKTYNIRTFGICPHNKPVAVVKKIVTQGQQKQRKGKR